MASDSFGNFELDPVSLEKVFLTSGHELTDEQLERLIEFYRKEREKLAQGATNKRKVKDQLEAIELDELVEDLTRQVPSQDTQDI